MITKLFRIYCKPEITFQWEFEQFWLCRKLWRREGPSCTGGTTSGWRPRPCSTSSRPPPHFRPCRPRSTMPTSCCCWSSYYCSRRTLFQHFSKKETTFFFAFDIFLVPAFFVEACEGITLFRVWQSTFLLRLLPYLCTPTLTRGNNNA